MGEVYRARDTRLPREVAIKIVPAELACDAARLKRFESEARLASALNHPNIVTIHEVGQSDSTSFIVMELVDGKTLRDCFMSVLFRCASCSRLPLSSPTGSPRLMPRASFTGI